MTSAQASPPAGEPEDVSPDYLVRPLLAEEQPRWAQLLRESPQATLFHSPLWLEATGAPFRLYGCFRGDELRAGVAVGLVGPNAAGHPESSLTPYLGLLLPPASDRVVTTQSTTKEITAVAAAFLRREFDSVHFRFPPEVVDLQPFLWRGFQAGVRYTYRLKLEKLDAVLAGMDATRRRNLRAAEKDGVLVVSDAPFTTMLELAEKTFHRQGREVGFRSGAVRVQAALAGANRCRAFVATDPSGLALGGVWIVWDERRAYYLIGGHDETAGSANATALAMWKAIQFTATELNLPEFDFEGSMVPAVERFFRKFGGTLLPTYTVTWRRPEGLAARITQKARRMVRGD